LHCNDGDDRLNNYFANPEVVTTPDPFAIGTAPRTLVSCRQPGTVEASLSIFKDFPVYREGMKFPFRFEAYNAFNHTRFQGPNTTLNSGSFGVITGQANSPREAQAELKFYF
jgi:hypothetical protein